MATYQESPSLVGPRGPRRGASIEFRNLIDRDLWWVDFNKLSETGFHVSGSIPSAGGAVFEWIQTNLGSPTSPGIKLLYEDVGVIPASIGLIQPGSAGVE